MNETSTHLDVPTVVLTVVSPGPQQRARCLGPDGAVAHVARVIRMIQGRWKLPILFRLYADASMRTLQMKRDLPGISQKVLTEQLRELVADHLIERIDFREKPLRVEYRLSPRGRDLMPVLIAVRAFSDNHPAADLA